jgi:ubiquinone/menaquinone biosynthesis C-methylase UbiE
LRFFGKALPDARLYGLDLSPQYIARARETLPRDLEVSLVCDDAEKLPFVDGHFDAATNLYLLHEVPRDVRSRVLGEMFRVLRPGGLAVVADSLQFGDAPELSRELRAFPERFHEPYYEEYAAQDLASVVAAAGFTVRDTTLAFLTKIVVAEKPS